MNSPICLRLFKQTVRWPFALARERAGNNIEARIAIIAITTSNSISVKPIAHWELSCFLGHRESDLGVFIPASAQTLGATNWKTCLEYAPVGEVSKLQRPRLILSDPKVPYRPDHRLQ